MQCHLGLYSVIRVPIAATRAHHVHGVPHIFIANGMQVIQLLVVKKIINEVIKINELRVGREGNEK